MLRLDPFAKNSGALDHAIALAAALDAFAPVKKTRGGAMLAGSRHFFVHVVLVVLTTIVSKCWHFGHSNVWRSWPGLSGSIPTSRAGVRHLEHKRESVGLLGTGAPLRRERYRALSHQRQDLRMMPLYGAPDIRTPAKSALLRRPELQIFRDRSHALLALFSAAHA